MTLGSHHVNWPHENAVGSLLRPVCPCWHLLLLLLWMEVLLLQHLPNWRRSTGEHLAAWRSLRNEKLLLMRLLMRLLMVVGRHSLVLVVHWRCLHWDRCLMMLMMLNDHLMWLLLWVLWLRRRGLHHVHNLLLMVLVLVLVMRLLLRVLHVDDRARRRLRVVHDHMMMLLLVMVLVCSKVRRRRPVMVVNDDLLRRRAVRGHPRYTSMNDMLNKLRWRRRSCRQNAHCTSRVRLRDWNLLVAVPQRTARQSRVRRLGKLREQRRLEWRKRR